MRALLKFSSVAVLILLVIMALGPENWQPRSGLRWEFDHFAGYFAITIFVCLAWPRSLLVWGSHHGLWIIARVPASIHYSHEELSDKSCCQHRACAV
jgi:hypothetical protein